MPCKEYEHLKYMRDMEMDAWAQYAYRENKHLRGGVGDKKAKQIAKEARAKANENGKAMQWHRESCEECKRGPG
jgi:hypothetical protein